MIGRLVGVIAERGLDGSCVVDVAGVGYEVSVPLGSLARMLEGERVTLHVHTHVREDALHLFGFGSLEDRAAFRAVMGVSGVGPKLAMALLGALGASELADAIVRGDHARFKGIPGVGKKTVERLVLELKDKLPALVGASTAGAPQHAPASALQGPLAVVAGALVQMGYKPQEATRAVATLHEPESRPVEVLLREALATLA